MTLFSSGYQGILRTLTQHSGWPIPIKQGPIVKLKSIHCDCVAMISHLGFVCSCLQILFIRMVLFGHLAAKVRVISLLYMWENWGLERLSDFGQYHRVRWRIPPPLPPLNYTINSIQFSYSVVSDSLWPRGLQHASLPCPSPTPEVYSNSCPLSRWCHPTISSPVIPFSSHLQSFPASGSFPVSQFFASGGQSIGVSASASVLPVNIQD